MCCFLYESGDCWPWAHGFLVGGGRVVVAGNLRCQANPAGTLDLALALGPERLTCMFHIACVVFWVQALASL